jgi:hypothetical protein
MGVVVSRRGGVTHDSYMVTKGSYKGRGGGLYGSLGFVWWKWNRGVKVVTRW